MGSKFEITVDLRNLEKLAFHYGPDKIAVSASGSAVNPDVNMSLSNHTETSFGQ